MAEDRARQLEPRGEQHRGPDDAVEPRDVLADDVKVGRPPLRERRGVVGEPRARDVVDQRVEPDVDLRRRRRTGRRRPTTRRRGRSRCPRARARAGRSARSSGTRAGRSRGARDSARSSGSRHAESRKNQFFSLSHCGSRVRCSGQRPPWSSSSRLNASQPAQYQPSYSPSKRSPRSRDALHDLLHRRGDAASRSSG